MRAGEPRVPFGGLCGCMERGGGVYPLPYARADRVAGVVGKIVAVGGRRRPGSPEPLVRSWSSNYAFSGGVRNSGGLTPIW